VISLSVRRALGLAFVVVVDDVDLVGLPADLQPTLRVDGVFPEVIAVAQELSLAGERPRETDRRTELQRFLGKGGRCCNCGEERETAEGALPEFPKSHGELQSGGEEKGAHAFACVVHTS